MRLRFPTSAGAVLLLAAGCMVTATAQGPSRQISPAIESHLDAGNYSEAERLARTRLEREPDWEAGHLLVGQICSLTGRYKEAERSARVAVRLRESLDGFMLLAVATMRLGKHNESIGWLEKAAGVRRDHPEIYKVLGLDYALGGNLVESEKAFRRAAELDPFNWEFRYWHGRALYELRLFRKSETALQQAVRLNGGSAKTWTALGQTQESLYEPAKAEASYHQAVETCGSESRACAWPLMQLGFLASRRQGPAKAVEFFRKSAAARPDWAKPHFYLGKTLATLGDFEEARAEFEAALRLDELKSEYHYQLSQTYRRLGDVRKAEHHLARYQALNDLERQGPPSTEFGDP
ncbi:MAG: tetratricopeptide repeat protein [Acidobacteria bacterium]|nr:tetratricopeptide repeat protein [Acidobacteriota bacterium]